MLISLSAVSGSFVKICLKFCKKQQLDLYDDEFQTKAVLMQKTVANYINIVYQDGL